MHGVKANMVQVRVPTTSNSWGFNDKEFKTREAAEAWLKKNGWKFMARRYVRVHHFTEFFYGKSVRAYNAGEYAEISMTGNVK